MLPGVRAFRVTLAVMILLAACAGEADRPVGQLTPVASPATDTPAPQDAPSDASTPAAEPASPSEGASPQPAPSSPDLAPSEPFGVTSVTLVSPDGTQRADLDVYVAATSAERGRGLMDRDDLPRDVGMIFLFPSDSSGAFYMYRTRIPLSIAFFDAAGEVVSVLDMEPCTSPNANACERYNPGATYRGALEVNQGAFGELGVTEGWTVELPPDLPAPS